MNFTYTNYFNNCLTPKEKTDAIKSLCKIEIANEKWNISKENSLKFSEQDKTKNIFNIISHYQSVSKLRKVLSYMKPDNAKLIEECFIKNKKPEEISKYISKATYYRNRKNAIEEFLYYYLNS